MLKRGNSMSDKNSVSINNASKRSEKIKKIAFSAVCLALCYVLPFLTANSPSLGNMLCLMHIPVLICGFLCGGQYGLVVGFVAPLLRTMIISMPPLLTAIPMAFELAVYGFVTGVVYKKLPKTLANVYISLISAMILGRFVGGTVKFIMYGLGYVKSFSAKAFISAYVFAAWPGILIQLVLIPVIVLALSKAGIAKKE